MITLQTENLTAAAVGAEHGLTDADLAAIEKLVPTAHERLQGWRASQDALFYDLVFDAGLTRGIAEAAGEIAGRCDDVVALGIGGSALGLRCAAQALLPPFWNLRAREARGGRPRLFVCDNVDPDTFAGLLDLVDLSHTCFIVISKSGTTAETAAQFQIVRDRLRKSLGDRWRRQLVLITDPERGELRPLAAKEGITAFAVPQKLGGRFSVLSAVGLVPAACVGIDIEALLAGARAMATRCAAPALAENPAYQLGGHHYWFATKKQKPISVMMPYADSLALAADWYAQLWAESLGKEGNGQTPVKALGSTDQHSQIQLYMEGPPDKVVTFLRAEAFRTPREATRITAEGNLAYLNGHDLGAILNAEQAATAAALAKAHRPNCTVSFPALDAAHVGEFFMLYEIATAFAGALWGINPFDQPGVELGKKLTREILSRR